jgi:hypothetical protein
MWMISEDEIEDAFKRAALSQVYIPGADKNVLP